MNFKERVKDSIANRAAEAIAVSVGVVLIWVATKLGPFILPALENSLPKPLLLSLLIASLALNVILVVLFWATRNKSEFKLKYGIYWDSHKNPHCPSCKVPIAGYSSYHSGKGYWCKPCNKLFKLQDPQGNNIDPNQAMSEI